MFVQTNFRISISTLVAVFVMITAVMMVWFGELTTGVADAAETPAKVCTEKENKRFDAVNAKLTVFGKYGTRFAETVKEMNGFCRTYKSNLNQHEEHSKQCLVGTTKQFMSIIAFSLKSVVKNFCSRKTKKRTNELLAMGKCANENNVTISSCVDNLTYKFQGIIRSDRKLMLPQVCCNYYSMLKCIQDVTNVKCPKYSEMIGDFLRNLFQNIIDVACGDYVESSDKCETLPPAPKRLKSDGLMKAVLTPLVTIWDKL